MELDTATIRKHAALIKAELEEARGPGSHPHAGRKGMRGGSAKGSGGKPQNREERLYQKQYGKPQHIPAKQLPPDFMTNPRRTELGGLTRKKKK